VRGIAFAPRRDGPAPASYRPAPCYLPPHVHRSRHASSWKRAPETVFSRRRRRGPAPAAAVPNRTRRSAPPWPGTAPSPPGCWCSWRR
jgi:hypothetical protein